MTAYPLADLISLRQRRYDAALSDKQARQRAVTAAQEQLEHKISELADYQVFKRTEIDRRYDRICGQVLSQDALLKFNEGLAALDIKETELEAEKQLLEAALSQAKEALRKAEEQAVLKQKQLLKLKSHRDIWLAEQKIFAERQADSELEDFQVKKSDFS